MLNNFKTNTFIYFGNRFICLILTCLGKFGSRNQKRWVLVTNSLCSKLVSEESCSNETWYSYWCILLAFVTLGIEKKISSFFLSKNGRQIHYNKYKLDAWWGINYLSAIFKREKDQNLCKRSVEQETKPMLFPSVQSSSCCGHIASLNTFCLYVKTGVHTCNPGTPTGCSGFFIHFNSVDNTHDYLGLVCT